MFEMDPRSASIGVSLGLGESGGKGWATTVHLTSRVRSGRVALAAETLPDRLPSGVRSTFRVGAL
jgi:hypothetical protein